MTKHGITIRDKKTKEIIRFIECETGRTALKILSGVRHNLNNKDFIASEEFI